MLEALIRWRTAVLEKRHKAEEDARLAKQKAYAVYLSKLGTLEIPVHLQRPDPAFKKTWKKGFDWSPFKTPAKVIAFVIYLGMCLVWHVFAWILLFYWLGKAIEKVIANGVAKGMKDATSLANKRDFHQN